MDLFKFLFKTSKRIVNQECTSNRACSALQPQAEPNMRNADFNYSREAGCSSQMLPPITLHQSHPLSPNFDWMEISPFFLHPEIWN